MPAYYTVATEINTGDGWRPIHEPVMTAAEDPDDLIDDEIISYNLDDMDMWIVRVYEGVRFDTVVRERQSGSGSPLRPVSS